MKKYLTFLQNKYNKFISMVNLQNEFRNLLLNNFSVTVSQIVFEENLPMWIKRVFLGNYSCNSLNTC